MNSDFNDIFSEAKKESLSQSERLLMRNTLISHMQENPARVPFRIRVADMLTSLADALGGQTATRMKFVPSALAMVLVIGVGTSYAAEGALPGDALYAIKLNVNESVKGAFAVSDESQASWHTEKIERRLVEAEALVAEGKLTPIAQASIESQIQLSAAEFDKNVQKLASTGSEAAVAAAQSDLEASLIGHAEVLVALTANADNAEEYAPVAPIIRSVITKAENAQAARANYEATVVAKRDGKQIRNAAIEKKNEAIAAVQNVRIKASSALAATTSVGEVAKESADAADVTIQVAEQRLENGDYGSAFSAFQEAIRTAKTIEVHIDATTRLKTDLQIFTRTAPQTGADAALMMTANPVQE